MDYIIFIFRSNMFLLGTYKKALRFECEKKYITVYVQNRIISERIERCHWSRYMEAYKRTSVITNRAYIGTTNHIDNRRFFFFSSVVYNTHVIITLLQLNDMYYKTAVKRVRVLHIIYAYTLGGSVGVGRSTSRLKKKNILACPL